MTLIQDLNWRYATQRMTDTRVSQDKVDRILEAINLTPTSFGLQAYKVIVVENQALKEKIFTEACQQQPIKDCSHLLVFAPYIELSEQTITNFIDHTVRARQLSPAWAEEHSNTINRFRNNNKEKIEAWLNKQVYIALGIACVVAANERVDSVPIEGFKSTELDRILELREKGLASSVLLPLGYRDESNDPLVNYPKVRKDLNDLIDVIK